MRGDFLKPSRQELIRGAVQIARPDYWFKNIFVLPGVLFAASFTQFEVVGMIEASILAFIVGALLASSNYIVNEYFDAPSDKHHPLKGSRPFAKGGFPRWIAGIEYGFFLVAGLAIAAGMGPQFLLASVLFVFSGLAYNVPPVRLKDRPYMDIISESFNIVLRLLLGWSAMRPEVLPPASLALSFWGAGAFIMTTKRLAEYRFLDNHDRAVLYRSSFSNYSEKRLQIISIFFISVASLFLGVFLIKYRVQYILLFPFLAAYFSWYFSIGMKEESVAQHPEQLYKETKFILFTGLLVVGLIFLTVVDLPLLKQLLSTHFIATPFAK